MRPDTFRQTILLVILAGLTLGIFACRSAPPPIVYYTLDPLPLSHTNGTAPAEKAVMQIGVGPVSLPTYLERSQIVTRSGDHTLAINDFNRWAGPLDEEILRVLLVSVGEALTGAEVLPYPLGRRYDPTHQVSVTVQRYDAQQGVSVHLRGSRHLTCHTDPGKNGGRDIELAEVVAAPTMQALVAAQNRALADQAGEMVAALCDAGE